MNLSKYLSKFDTKDLLKVLGADWLSALIKVQGGTDFAFKTATSEQLSQIVASVYGTKILEQESMRHLILACLPERQIRELAERLLKTVYAAKMDNVRNLAHLKWSRSSPLISVILDDLGFSQEYLPEVIQKRQSSELISPNIKLHPLHDYQVELRDRIADDFLKNSKSFLVQLPTGSGKTRILMEAIVRYYKINAQLPASKGLLWLAHSEELLEQAIETVSKVWAVNGTDVIRINRFFGSYNPALADFSNSLNFASLQKIGRWATDRPEELERIGALIGTVVVDEAHKIAAPTYLKSINVLNKHQEQILVGVTATPGRSTENEFENYLLQSIFNGNLVTADLGPTPIKELQNRGILAKLNRIKIDTELQNFGPSSQSSDNDGQDFSPKYLRLVGQSPLRNQSILDAIETQRSQQNSTLVFACNIEHAKVLCAGLAIRGVRAAYLDNETSASIRRRIIEDYKSGEVGVLINYGILTTGFDAPCTKAVLIARPTKSIVLYSQMIGRGLRGPLVGGNKECNLIDVVDNASVHGGLEDIYSYFDEYWK